MRERFDPPLLRARWTVAETQPRDAFLADLRARTGWDAARVERVLWHGGLHLDGRPHGGADLPAEIGACTRADAYAFAWEPALVSLDAGCILAEGGDWLAADKPPFVPTQRTRASERVSLEAALRALTGCAALVAVHRLDRETSGVVLFAKTRDAARQLGTAFAQGAVRKRYLAVVSPAPKRIEWETTGFLGRVLDPKRYRFALRGDAAPGFRATHTRFTVLAHGADRALVACAPTTGRTHQLRVHLAVGGTPIAGDPTYGGVAAERTLLHASELAIPAVLDVAARVPEAFEPRSFASRRARPRSPTRAPASAPRG